MLDPDNADGSNARATPIRRSRMTAPGSNLKINGERLWDSLMEMAKIGPGVKGGNRRLTLTDVDREGRDLFKSWAEKAGCKVVVDTMGNMFCRREGTDPLLPPVMVGSHLDTQPTGGKFDGVLGVLSGLEMVRTLNDLGIKTRHPIEVVNWTNEEGSRYAPAMIASGVFAGVYDQDYAYTLKDAEGQGARRRAEAHRLCRQRAGGQAAAQSLLRIPHRAGADPRARKHRHRRRHARPGPALVRRKADRLREPRRLDADGAPPRCAGRRGAAGAGGERDRAVARAARGRHGRRAEALSGLAQRHPGLGRDDGRFPPPDRRGADRREGRASAPPSSRSAPS